MVHGKGNPKLKAKKWMSVARQTGNPLIFMPFCKDADGFKKFYRAAFKQVIVLLIEEGYIPLLLLREAATYA